MPKGINLLPPTTYQGGKQRLSAAIVDFILELEGRDIEFYDLCCGSGAVGLEVINQGLSATFIDKGAYGKVWEDIGKGLFDIEIFKEEIEKLPNIDDIKDYLYKLSVKQIDEERMVYHYLLLQAGSFGGKQIWITEDNKWGNNSFRSFWKPTATSNRRSVVNPMMPMPITILDRMGKIIEHKESITGYYQDIEEFADKINYKKNQVFYIDPPYKKTTGYKDSFDIDKVVRVLRKKGVVYVSEGYDMEEATEYIELSVGRKKGNISGNVKKAPVKEILNIFREE